MKRKIFTAIFVLALAILTLNASKKNDEISRMGIFISNFTELGMFEFDLEDSDEDDGILHLGNPSNMGELIRFGIGHNIINNPKTTVKKCTRKRCEYGRSMMSGAAVAASVEKYFDLDVRHKSVLGDAPEAEYDGKNYHFDTRNWEDDTIYYAEVQDVRKGKGFVQMEGELYNLHKKSDRPAYFVAKAKPYKYNGKNTWSILSLRVEWK